jgi:hypothetical protein
MNSNFESDFGDWSNHLDSSLYGPFGFCPSYQLSDFKITEKDKETMNEMEKQILSEKENLPSEKETLLTHKEKKETVFSEKLSYSLKTLQEQISNEKSFYQNQRNVEINSFQLFKRKRKSPPEKLSLSDMITKKKFKMQTKILVSDNIQNTRFPIMESGLIIKKTFDDQFINYDFKQYESEIRTFIIGLDFDGENLYCYTNQKFVYHTKLSQITIPTEMFFLNTKGLPKALEKFKIRKSKKFLLFNHQSVCFFFDAVHINTKQIKATIHASMMNEYMLFQLKDELTFDMNLIAY